MPPSIRARPIAARGSRSAPTPATRRSHHAASSTPRHAPAFDRRDHRLGEREARVPGARCRAASGGRAGWHRPRSLVVAGEHRRAARRRPRRPGTRRAAARPSRCSRRCARALIDPHHHHAVWAVPEVVMRDRTDRDTLPPMRVISGSAGAASSWLQEGSSTPTHLRSGPGGHLQRPRQPRRGAGGAVLDLFAGAERWASRPSRGRQAWPPSGRRHRGAPSIEANLVAVCGLSSAAEVVASPAEQFLADSTAAPVGPGAPGPALRLRRLARRCRIPHGRAGGRGRRSALRLGGRPGEALRPHPW